MRFIKFYANYMTLHDAAVRLSEKALLLSEH